MLQPSSSYHLANVVAPGQEEHAGVVFLPVRQDEREEDDPEQAVEREHADSALAAPEHGVQRAHKEHTCPAVQAVVEQLAQRSARVCPAGLLPVDTICSHTQIHTLVCFIP